jgi:signal transduction histidine kinase
MSARNRILSGRTILVVDDQAEACAAVRALLEQEGHRVLAADSLAASLPLLERESVQLMLVAQDPQGPEAERLIRGVRERDPLVQIVLQTGRGATPLRREAVRHLAVQGHHDQGDGPERLLLTVDVALRAYDQLAQLHVAERLKTELLANVSHEFRTPLNVIAGYVELIREGTFGSCPLETMPVLAKVLGNTAYLLELVEEFLDLSKLEAGAMLLRREAIELTPFLRELGESFALLVRTKPVEFLSDVPEGLPAVTAETAKLRIVIQNLLSNAEKFTKRGHIRLTARLLPAGRVAIHVADTGPGIAPEHHEKIFDLFHQLRPADAETKGIGLGLALARRFARMMEGDITLESKAGQGSTFTVVLPAAGGSVASGGTRSRDAAA